MKGIALFAVFLLGWAAAIYKFADLPSFFPMQMQIAHLESQAEDGNTEAMVKLGETYASGAQVERDIMKALGWYKEALYKDHPEAHYHLGNLALRGQHGIRRNCEFALEHLEKAADLGIAEAHFSLAHASENNICMPPSITEAYLRYFLAKLFGSEEANRHLVRLSTKIRRSVRQELESQGHKIHSETAGTTAGSIRNTLRNFRSVAGEKAVGDLNELVTDAGTVNN